MFESFEHRIVPRNGHTLVVGIVARISGCASQKELSLDDQVDHAKEVIEELFDGTVDYQVVATKGKGERLDRPELQQIDQMVRRGELDFLVMEDVGRLVRGGAAVRLWGIAVDHGTRCIAPNDGCDTAKDTWEEDLLAACSSHVSHQSHTSKRIKKKTMNRFKKFGGSVALPIAGYIKPDGAKTYDDWLVDPSAKPIVQEGLRRLMITLNCSEIAEWFNDVRFPTGEYRRCRKTWDGSMVRKFYANSLLMGRPTRGKRHSVKHHESGRRVSVPNPNGPVYYECPHLALITPEEFDEINTRLDEKNKGRGRKKSNGKSPRWHVPYKRTRFPGQHARCWYCGRHYVWGGNGITKNLMCRGPREWHCWNSIGIEGQLVSNRLMEIITQELYKLDGFDAQFRELVEAAHKNHSGGGLDDQKQLERDEFTLQREKENLLSAIMQCGPRPMLQQKMSELEDSERELAQRRSRIAMFARQELKLPQSVDELRGALEQQFERLACDSFEFSDFMRQLVPDLFVYLVRRFDGGHPLPRARVTINLAGCVADANLAPGLVASLSREVTLDLFKPTQCERIREEAVQWKSQGLLHREIACQIAERPTTTAVSNALILDRRMKELGLESPYVLLLEPPDDYRKLRRHKNSKYRFESEEGYVRKPL